MSVVLTTLPSGLRIVTDTMAHVETASIGVFVGAGSRHETLPQHGLSHFLEHMAFKGTRRRSAKDIAEEIETAGGDLNAATGVEQTAYYARVLAQDSELALDILADILTDSAFDPVELEREKGVILQEIGSVEDAPDDLVFDLFNAAAFPDQPIGRAILGTPEAVGAFDRAAIDGFLKSHYRSGATVIAAAGALQHEAIVEAAARRFDVLPQHGQPAAPAAAYKGGAKLLKRRLEQAHLVVGFEGVSFYDPDSYAAYLFGQAAGGGMSSRLFQEVREKRGLAYAIYTFNWGYADAGLFGFYAACGSGDIAQLMPLALDCLGETALTLSEAELIRAKAQMKVSLLAALESSSARAEQIARQVLAFGRELTRAEIIGRIDAITLAQVRAAGAKLLRSAPTVAAIGPVGKVMAPARIAAHLAGV